MLLSSRMDDSEIKDLLLKNLELSKENNKLLRKLRSSQRWSNITRTMYWLLLIGISIGAFYFVQPYIDQIKSVYLQAGTDYDQFKNIGNNLPSFLKTNPTQK